MRSPERHRPQNSVRRPFGEQKLTHLHLGGRCCKYVAPLGLGKPGRAIIGKFQASPPAGSFCAREWAHSGASTKLSFRPGAHSRVTFRRDVCRTTTHADDGAVPPDQGRTARGRAVAVPAGRFLRDVLRGRPDRGAVAQSRADQARQDARCAACRSTPPTATSRACSRPGAKWPSATSWRRPQPGKLVKREVTQILSPGTHFDERMLVAERNNFLAARVPRGKNLRPGPGGFDHGRFQDAPNWNATPRCSPNWNGCARRKSFTRRRRSRARRAAGQPSHPESATKTGCSRRKRRCSPCGNISRWRRWMVSG